MFTSSGLGLVILVLVKFKNLILFTSLLTIKPEEPGDKKQKKKKQKKKKHKIIEHKVALVRNTNTLTTKLR